MLLVCTDPIPPLAISRRVIHDILGRNTLSKESNLTRIGFVHSTYPNRAIEWISIRHICQDALKRQGYDDFIPHLENITFGWRYHEQFRSMVYKPAKVFRDFSFDESMFRSSCPCNLHNRFSKYLDPTTAGSNQDSQIPSVTDIHVRTMDIGIIRDFTLKSNFKNGLNHIPLRQTLLNEVVETILDAWEQVCLILQIDPFDLKYGSLAIYRGISGRSEHISLNNSSVFCRGLSQEPSC